MAHSAAKSQSNLENNLMDYMNPNLPAGLRHVRMPVVDATSENFVEAGYGHIVSHPDERPLEIVRWPAQGWRPVDEDSGDEGGVAEGIFVSSWQGHVLFGSNEAVSGNYVLGYSEPPEVASDSCDASPQRVMLWHANYHPDGAQQFFPIEQRPYLVPVALPGDDVKPEDFVCFRFQGNQGCYIHPNIWHEGVFAIGGTQRFQDRQGKVHARVSVNFALEFECLLVAEFS